MKRLIPLLIAAASVTACASGGDRYGYDRYGADRYGSRDRAGLCRSCGEVTRIEALRGSSHTSGGGAVAGAVVGGVLGSNVGSGDGRRAATVAGAVIGGLAGNAIERDRNEQGGYRLQIRMDDGRRVRVEQRNLAGIREGDRVMVSNGGARLL